MQRVAHEDTRDALFSANLAEAAEIVAAIHAFQDQKRLRRELQFVGESQADSLAAVVNRQNPARPGFRRGGGAIPNSGTRARGHILLASIRDARRGVHTVAAGCGARKLRFWLAWRISWPTAKVTDSIKEKRKWAAYCFSCSLYFRCWVRGACLWPPRPAAVTARLLPA